MNEFLRIYDKYSMLRPLALTIQHLKRGVERWRIHVFEFDKAPTGGDKELLCIENPDREEALKIAGRRLSEICEQKAEEKGI